MRCHLHFGVQKTATLVALSVVLVDSAISRNPLSQTPPVFAREEEDDDSPRAVDQNVVRAPRTRGKLDVLPWELALVPSEELERIARRVRANLTLMWLIPWS